jgi:hypothetical protein
MLTAAFVIGGALLITMVAAFIAESTSGRSQAARSRRSDGSDAGWFSGSPNGSGGGADCGSDGGGAGCDGGGGGGE